MNLAGFDVGVVEALFAACKSDATLDKLKSLLTEHGAKLLLCSNDAQQSPMHVAASSKSLGALALLLDNVPSAGISVDIADKKGSTPLHLAAKAQSLVAINLLLDKVMSFCSAQFGLFPSFLAAAPPNPCPVVLTRDACVGAHASLAVRLVERKSNCARSRAEHADSRHGSRRRHRRQRVQGAVRARAAVARQSRHVEQERRYW